jgi:hypothetical protein
MAQLSFKGLEGVSCNLSVNATGSIDQCSVDIEIINKSKQTCHASCTQSHDYATKQVAYLIGSVFRRLLLPL